MVRIPLDASQYRRPTTLILVFLLALALGLAVSSSASAASGSKVLVFNEDDNGSEGVNAAQSLRDLGFSVDRETNLPTDLDDYSSIWFVTAYGSLQAADVDRLADYIAEGGNAYLTGERPCCELLNFSVAQLLDKVLTNQNVQVGGLGDIEGPFVFNPNATDDVADSPNDLTDFLPGGPGGMASI